MSEKTLTELDILDKPEQIFNCDETGFSRKECSVKSKVFGVKGSTTKCNEVNEFNRFHFVKYNII